VEWGIYLVVVVVAVLAAGLGYAGGHVALRTERRRRPVAEAPPIGASFRLEHREASTWSVVNVGDRAGSHVTVLPFVDGLEQWPPQAVPGQVQTATSELLPTLRPKDAMSVWFSHYDVGLQVLVSWTTEDDVRMGPVRLSVPPPR
jgi:hypothetical protein